MNTSQTLREYINRHVRCTTLLAVLGAALDAQLAETLSYAALQVRIDEVLNALGIGEITAGVSPAELKQMLAEIRFNMLLDTKLLFSATRSLAWTHRETEILQAGGDLSAGFAEPLTYSAIPELDGLAQRLSSPDAAFLDIGVGTAGLSIALAQLWPSLKIVGIDIWAPSLVCAQENVQRASLTDRIQLREQTIEQLTDQTAFDLAWLPSAFIPERAISAACEAVYRALHPGGWLLFSMANPGTDPVTASLVRLRTTFWGGSLLSQNQVESLLSAAGFVDIRVLKSPPNALVAMIAARRSLETRSI